jgi:hypothetical protein
MCIISGLYSVVFHTQTYFRVSLCIFCIYTEHWHINVQCITMCIISGLYSVVFHTQTCFRVSLCILYMYTENYHINVQCITTVCV